MAINAHIEGQRARKLGQAIGSNPYTSGQDRQRWFAGWLMADTVIKKGQSCT